MHEALSRAWLQPVELQGELWEGSEAWHGLCFTSPSSLRLAAHSRRAWEEQVDETGPSCSLLLLPSGRVEKASQENPFEALEMLKGLWHL